MTRILVQRGSGSSSSNQSRSAQPSSLTSPQSSVNPSPPTNSAVKDEDIVEEIQETIGLIESSEQSTGDECKDLKTEVVLSAIPDQADNVSDENDYGDRSGNESLVQADSSQGGVDNSQPPPPPVPPPRPLTTNSSPRRVLSSTSIAARSGPSRRGAGWPAIPRTSPTGSKPSSPRSHCENEGYNSADEQNPVYGPSCNDIERERQFELDIRRSKGLEVKRMLEDGNCLFRAVADQVYGDPELYDLARQMCIDYMERERDHFSQFITEGFTSYCKRKRRDKIQALCEMYNRPIHIYSYSTDPINIFQGNYETDLPPIRLSYHHGNHYNSLVDPRRLTIGAGLGFSSLRGRHVDKDQIKAAIKAQQDQQIDGALLAEGRFYSDLELTEKEIERMVMEASRAEYLAVDKFKPQQIGRQESSTSGAEPSSSGSRKTGVGETGKQVKASDSGMNNSIQMILSMGFSYLQAIEAYSIFGDDVDSMVCYLLETSSSGRRKGKATE
ncbi:hypothetical protein V2J09_011882 [Rumex salicifolius]